MPASAISAAAAAVGAAAARPVLRRAKPAVQELFRNGCLYQPAPREEVADHLRRYTLPPTALLQEPHAVRASPSSAIISAGIDDQTDGSAVFEQYKTFYKPNTQHSLDKNNFIEKSYSESFHTKNAVLDSSSEPIIENDETRQQAALRTYSVEEEVDRRSRRLTVLFTWLGAKEKYAHKYIGLWTQRGNAVLHITCSIGDLLMPRTGAEVTAGRVRDHIGTLDGWRVLVHGLSVGGYITQHVLKTGDKDITSKLSHQIYDSFTNVEGLAEGVENAVPSRYSSIAKRVGRLYMRYADMSSFNESRNFILNGAANSPVFFMHSMADRVAQYSITKPLVEAMQRKTAVDTFLVPAGHGVPHVALLRHMGPPVYMRTIETFLQHHPDPVE